MATEANDQVWAHTLVQTGPQRTRKNMKCLEHQNDGADLKGCLRLTRLKYVKQQRDIDMARNSKHMNGIDEREYVGRKVLFRSCRNVSGSK